LFLGTLNPTHLLTHVKICIISLLSLSLIYHLFLPRQQLKQEHSLYSTLGNSYHKKKAKIGRNSLLHALDIYSVTVDQNTGLYIFVHVVWFSWSYYHYRGKNGDAVHPLYWYPVWKGCKHWLEARS